MKRTNRIPRLLAILLLVQAGGCAGVAAIDSGRLLQAYADCNQAAARRLAASGGDPIELSIAAEASCTSRRTSLERAYRRAAGEAQARQLIDSVRSAAVASNAAIIAGG
jgi:hypothetical protein